MWAYRVYRNLVHLPVVDKVWAVRDDYRQCVVCLWLWTTRSDSQLPASMGTEWSEEAMELGISIPPDRWDSGKMFSPEGSLAKQNRGSRVFKDGAFVYPHARTWVGFSVTCCELSVGPLTFSCTVWLLWPAALSFCLCESSTQRPEICQFQGRSSYASAGSCRDFCSVCCGSLCLPLSLILVGSALPCDLISLMGLRSCWFPV